VSGHAVTILPIPKETARTARAVFGPSNFYIAVGDRLKTIVEGIHLEYLSDGAKDRRLDAAVLPLITFFQFAEGLTDVQAVDALRTRADWKYALHLPVNALVIRERSLCEFRCNLWNNPQGLHEFQKLTDRLLLLHPAITNRVKPGGEWGILELVCAFNRLDLVVETFSKAIEVLAIKFPEWLLEIAQPHWYGRYNRAAPKLDSRASLSQEEISMREAGSDIHYLLNEVSQVTLHEISALPEIQALEYVWHRQFEKDYLRINIESEPSQANACDFCILTHVSNRDTNINV
jgi:transposase